MITLKTIKKHLFSNVRDQQSLLKTIRRHNNKIHNFDKALQHLFFELSDEDSQVILAPYLRLAAVEHVKTSGSYTFFRTQYVGYYGQKELDDYLNTQRRNKVFGADEEAKALAEIFGVALKVTVLHGDSDSCSYVARDVIDVPMVHIYNQTNIHWYIHENQPALTIGDGNCLYNSFAQILRSHLLKERDYERLFSKNDLKIYQTQDQLRADFDKLPCHTNEKLASIVSNLTEEEVLDHQYSLELARQDFNRQTVENLLTSINELYLYGVELQGKGSSKGQIVVCLASDLTEFVQLHSMDLPEANADLITLLNSKNNELGELRGSLDTIIKNILIALTGIGIVAIVGQLIHSQATEGRALFFFQKNKTTSEEKIQKINELVDPINLS